MGIIPAGAYRNREFIEDKVSICETVNRAVPDILFDPQTSGGLLISLPENQAHRLLDDIKAHTPDAAIIGCIKAKGEHAMRSSIKNKNGGYEFMKLAISAPRGKMGKLVTREALKRSGDFEVVGGIGPKGRDYIGCDMSVAAKTDFVGANTYDDVEKVVAMSDGVVDFSTTEGAMEVARACVKYRKPLMLGTTGFTEEQMAELEECAKTIPILIAHNTSKAVNLVYEIARMLTESIGGESDIEIIEMHDNKKLVSPPAAPQRSWGRSSQASAAKSSQMLRITDARAGDCAKRIISATIP